MSILKAVSNVTCYEYGYSTPMDDFSGTHNCNSSLTPYQVGMDIFWRSHDRTHGNVTRDIYFRVKGQKKVHHIVVASFVDSKGVMLHE